MFSMDGEIHVGDRRILGLRMAADVLIDRADPKVW